MKPTTPPHLRPDLDDDPPEASLIVDEVLAELAAFLPPEARDETREFVLDALAAHPLGRDLLRRVLPVSAPDHSEERDRDEEHGPGDTTGRAAGKATQGR